MQQKVKMTPIWLEQKLKINDENHNKFKIKLTQTIILLAKKNLTKTMTQKTHILQ